MDNDGPPAKPATRYGPAPPGYDNGKLESCTNKDLITTNHARICKTHGR